MVSSDGQTLERELPAALVVELEADGGFDWHSHEHHQIALAERGVLTMAVAGATWVLPRSRALWVPAGEPHAVRASTDTTMISLYIDPGRGPRHLVAPTVVDARGVVGELIVHLSNRAVEDPERRRAEAVLWDLLRPVPVTALPLPWPRDDRARRVADSLRDDPADGRSLAEWGHLVGASGRTLARRFTTETGLSFASWRTNARLAAALPLLADGMTNAAVAARVGYATPSAFVAAFHRELGTTPGRYFHAD
jgi:AraC-like DNA-binding protein